MGFEIGVTEIRLSGKYMPRSVSNENVVDIWNNDEYENVRKFLRGEIEFKSADFPCKLGVKY